MQLRVSHKQRFFKLSPAVCVLVSIVMLYVLVYTVLSANGQYQPEIVGVSDVKTYGWAPLGFYDANHPWKNSVAAQKSKATVYGGWNRFMVIIFYPLFYLDHTWLHKPK